MLDAIAETIVNFLTACFKFLIVTVCYNIILFVIGCTVLKIVTLWQYPKEEISERDKAIISNTGLTTLLASYTAFFIINGFILH